MRRRRTSKNLEQDQCRPLHVHKPVVSSLFNMISECHEKATGDCDVQYQFNKTSYLKSLEDQMNVNDYEIYHHC